jgi:tetratricopeptide (TPR) repeat protein
MKPIVLLWAILALGIPLLVGAQDKPAPPAEKVPREAGTRADNSSEQAIYQYLISEIAGQRGRSGLAWSGMMDLARKTGDARVARRAVEVAFQSRQPDQAAEAAILWAELEPASPGPRQALSALAGGNLDTVKAAVDKWLAGSLAPATIFRQLPGIVARYPEKEKISATVRELARPHANLREAQWAIAQTALAAGESDIASKAADETMRIAPDWPEAALLKAQVLRTTSEGDAGAFLRDFLQKFPASDETRLGYARLLTAQKNFVAAREQFRILAKVAPNDPELAYSIAVISQQVEDFADADEQYRRVLALKPRDPNPVMFNLGLVGESRKDVDTALSWYRRVGEGEFFIPAQLRIAGILAKRDGMEAGRRFLREARNVESDAPEIRNQLYLAESQLLRDARAYEDALKLLSEAIAGTPDAADLLYDRAMVAEKLDRLDMLEADLRRVIEIQPDRSHAYNALGYTLAERNLRLDEAGELIRKALQLSPDDAFIQDSLGWLQFRQGKVQDALATLRKAYQTRHDAEIAAHLGEVLWASGKRDEALQVWSAALKDNPGHEILTNILAKYSK